MSTKTSLIKILHFIYWENQCNNIRKREMQSSHQSWFLVFHYEEKINETTQLHI